MSLRECFLCVLMLVAVLSAKGRADLYRFYGITHNNAVNEVIGEAQMSVEVTDAGANSALFTFRNEGLSACSITGVYFDDGTLLGIAGITNGDGVLFSQGARPNDLPGGNSITPRFDVTEDFSADSDSPVQPNGVNPGEFVQITFNLINGQTFTDTINALAKAIGDGGLRIGIKVQGFQKGGSESFINHPEPEPVPIPGAALLGFLGLGTAGMRLRGRR